MVAEIGSQHCFCSQQPRRQRIVAESDACLLQRFLQQPLRGEMRRIQVVRLCGRLPTQFNGFHNMLATFGPIPIVELQHRCKRQVTFWKIRIECDSLQRASSCVGPRIVGRHQSK